MGQKSHDDERRSLAEKNKTSPMNAEEMSSRKYNSSGDIDSQGEGYDLAQIAEDEIKIAAYKTQT